MVHSFRKVGTIEISNMCLQSYPCKHFILFNNGEEKIMSGDKIFTLLKENQLSDEHFCCYEEFIRKRDFPTFKEIYERVKGEFKMKQYEKDRLKKHKEQQIILQQFKASSRLDKLKQHCNISK